MSPLIRINSPGTFVGILVSIMGILSFYLSGRFTNELNASLTGIGTLFVGVASAVAADGIAARRRTHRKSRGMTARAIIDRWQKGVHLELYLPFLNALNDQESVLPAVEAKVREGSTLTIVMNDPQSEAAARRAEWLSIGKYYTKSMYLHNVEMFRERVEFLCKKYPDNVRLKVTNKEMESAGYFVLDESGRPISGLTCRLTEKPLLMEIHEEVPAGPYLDRVHRSFQHKFGIEFDSRGGNVVAKNPPQSPASFGFAKRLTKNASA